MGGHLSKCKQRPEYEGILPESDKNGRLPSDAHSMARSGARDLFKGVSVNMGALPARESEPGVIAFDGQGIVRSDPTDHRFGELTAPSTMLTLKVAALLCPRCSTPHRYGTGPASSTT